jgi:oxygen-independent coproporphyrinogen-3 oxidase
VLRRHILRLMTRLRDRWDQPGDYTEFVSTAHSGWRNRRPTGWCSSDAASCRVTEKGRAYLRNICMAFDARLARRMPDKALFSRTV